MLWLVGKSAGGDWSPVGAWRCWTLRRQTAGER